jgi:hypothetical protein
MWPVCWSVAVPFVVLPNCASWENVKPLGLPWIWVRLSVVLPLLSSYLQLISASHSAFPNKIFTHLIFLTYVLHCFLILNCYLKSSEAKYLVRITNHDFKCPGYAVSIIPMSLHLLARQYYCFPPSFIHFKDIIRKCDCSPLKHQTHVNNLLYKKALPMALKTQVVPITKYLSIYCAVSKRLATPSEFHIPLPSIVPFAYSETPFTHDCNMVFS